MTTRTTLWMTTVVCLALGASESAQAQWWNPMTAFTPYQYGSNSSCPNGNCAATRYAPMSYSNYGYRPTASVYSNYGTSYSSGSSSCPNGNCGLGSASCANGRCGVGSANGQCGSTCPNGQCGNGTANLYGRGYINNANTNYRVNSYPSTGYSTGTSNRVQYLPAAPVSNGYRHTTSRSPFFD